MGNFYGDLGQAHLQRELAQRKPGSLARSRRATAVTALWLTGSCVGLDVRVLLCRRLVVFFCFFLASFGFSCFSIWNPEGDAKQDAPRSFAFATLRSRGAFQDGGAW